MKRLWTEVTLEWYAIQYLMNNPFINILSISINSFIQSCELF